MASSSNTAWMPSRGRYPVNVGSSLNRALKARKLKGSPAATTTKRSNLPERDFYSIRYNFKPTSVDTTRPASIEIKKGPENSAVTAEYPSTQPGEAHLYLGVENPATEVDCVLIYDEDAGTYTLEKMDSFLAIRFDRKTAMANSPRPVSPSPPLASSSKKASSSKHPSTSKSSSSRAKPDADELERQLPKEDGREADESLQAVSHSKKHLRREEEEEEEDELPRPSPPPPKRQAPAPKTTRPVKPLPKARVPDGQTTSSASVRVQRPAPASQSAPSKPKPAPAPPAPPPAATAAPAPPKPRPLHNKDKGKKPKRDEDIAPPPLPPAVFEDDIVLEFGKPAKRPRPSTPPILPPPPPSVGLSLPGGSGTFSLPPPAPVPTSRAPGASSRAAPQPSAPPSPSHMIADESDEEEDWEQVPTVNANPGSVGVNTPQGFHIELEEEDGNDYHNTTDTYNDIDLERDIFGSGDEEEIDVNELEKELNAEMEMEDIEEEDFLTEAMEPISLNQFAGGSGGGMSDDEFSSSEESEDD